MDGLVRYVQTVPDAAQPPDKSFAVPQVPCFWPELLDCLARVSVHVLDTVLDSEVKPKCAVGFADGWFKGVI